MSPRAQISSRLAVDWTAKQIADPVLRLRFLRRVAPPMSKPGKKYNLRETGRLLGLSLLIAGAAWSLRVVSSQDRPVRVARPAQVFAAKPVGTAAPAGVVWQVEATRSFDSYSNGLRIENQYAVNNRPRSYVTFPVADPGSQGQLGHEPVGIVFHTTESLQAPFEPSQNAVLKKVAESTLEYVRRKRAYNFLIDRFGRVHRVVHESDAANHSGHSVWADDARIYVNLNDSFLGVSFEAKTANPEINPAQLRAAAMLTEMLRSRYKISPLNCVTHAQVSVNPRNFRIGYHVDWASSFPFERLGLPDNYARPLPALTLFGFRSDEEFEHRAGPRLAASAELAQDRVVDRAEAAHLTLALYTKGLRERYRRVAAASRHPQAAAEE